MQIRAVGKWALASGLIALFVTGGVKSFDEMTKLKAEGKELPLQSDPKFFVPAVASLSAAVVVVTVL